MNPDNESRHSLAEAEIEADWLQRVACKDRNAFELLYRAYFRRLTRFLDKVTRRPQMIDEILDDTMLVVWDRAASYTGASRVSTWIFGIAYNKALKALSREQRHEGGAGEPTVEYQDGPEDELMARESRGMIFALLDQLPLDQRAVVDLTYYYGYAYREIAAIVGCPVDTVKTRMFYARRKLRALIIAESRKGK